VNDRPSGAELLAELVDDIAERAAEIVLERQRAESPPSAPPDELISVAEVARQCQVTKKVVYGAIGRGELAASRLGSRLRVRRSAVDDWVSTTRVQAARSAPPRTPARKPPGRVMPQGAGLVTLLTPDE
jgi:excisionase family DNA binding protein